MKLKTAFASLLCALTGSLAMATPVTFEKGGLNGTFSETYHFTVGSERLYLGEVKTRSKNPDELSISSVVLSKGNTEYRFDSSDDAYKFLSITSSDEDEVIKNEHMHWYRQTYALSPVTLSAGDWTMTVNGFDIDNKTNGFFAAALVDEASDVPEPASLALVLVAGVALVLVSRRKRAAR